MIYPFFLFCYISFLFPHIRNFQNENIKKLCEFEQSIIDEIGVEKVELPKAEIDAEIESAVRDYATADMLAAIQIKEKLEKYAKIDEVKEFLAK